MTRWLAWSCGALALFACLGAPALAQSDDERFKAVRARGLGLRLFVEHCESCHGRSGHGDGPRAKELTAIAPDLTRLAERNGWRFPAGAVAHAIEGADPAHRTREMPLWGDVFRTSPQGAGQADVKERIDALVLYLEFVQARPRRR
jgi:mono/diheme cytochrome c family protein